MYSHLICLTKRWRVKRNEYGYGKSCLVGMDCCFSIFHRMDIMYEVNLYFACGVALMTLSLMGLDIFHKS